MFPSKKDTPFLENSFILNTHWTQVKTKLYSTVQTRRKEIVINPANLGFPRSGYGRTGRTGSAGLEVGDRIHHTIVHCIIIYILQSVEAAL